MDKREIDGVMYVPQEAMQSAMEERIRKLSTDRVSSDDKAKELQSQLDELHGKLGNLDSMVEEIADYKKRLSESDSRYQRHASMASQGITDPDLIEAVEWSYQKTMMKIEESERVELSDWLNGIKENPDTAPSILRPHFQVKTIEEKSIEENPEGRAAPEKEIDPPVLLPPRTNAGVKQAPVKSGDMISNGIQDLDYYRANRKAILSKWRNQ
tara:strand:- start:825 stop:1460 length:636 start_codon:yes stop_codon:yes gene_type:complete